MVCTAALIVGAGGWGSVASAADNGSEEQPDPDRTSADGIKEAIRFRTDFGLPNDPAFVATASSDEVAYPDSAWGVPLSAIESAELARRERLQATLEPAVAFASASDRYSGFYLDQQSGGVPVFMFVDPSDDVWTAIAERLPAGTEFRVEARERTYADLALAVDAIERDLAGYAGRGIEITAYGIDQAKNTVVVGIDGGLDLGRRELTARFGEAVDFRQLAPAEADACNGISDCWPPKGGIKVISSLDGGICTSAFVARRTDTNGLVLVTAGHCLPVHGGSEVPWTHHGNTIGKSKEYVWQAFTSADVGLIRINNAAVADMAGNYRRYLSDNSPITVSNLTGVNNNQQQGFAVCRMGWAS